MSAEPRVLLVCSPGGHLMQLHGLRAPLLNRYHRSWVTLRKPDAEGRLANENVYWAYGPTNRNVMNLLRNIAFAYKVLRTERPTIVITTGAGVGVPFIILARMMGMETVYIESFARKDSMSLSGRLAKPFVKTFIVQSEKLLNKVPDAHYLGTIY